MAGNLDGFPQARRRGHPVMEALFVGDGKRPPDGDGRRQYTLVGNGLVNAVGPLLLARIKAVQCFGTFLHRLDQTGVAAVGEVLGVGNVFRGRGFLPLLGVGQETGRRGAAVKAGFAGHALCGVGQ